MQKQLSKISITSAMAYQPDKTIGSSLQYPKEEIHTASVSWKRWWGSISPAKRFLPLIFCLLYWMIHFLLNGLRIDHFLIGGICLVLYYGGPGCRGLFRFLLPVLIMIALYDSQRYYADLLRSDIHVIEPYLFDKMFFGVETEKGILLPTQWWQRHPVPLLDFITGISYINFVPVFLVVAAYYRFGLYRKPSPFLPAETIRKQVSKMMWGMLWLNLASCATFYWYPAAPPWYVDLYGLGPARLDVLPSAAGAARFDALTGFSLLTEYYSRNPNIFGAIPSYHVALPLFNVYFAFKFKSLRFFCVGFYLLMCFSAVYLNHHYVLDIIVGSFYAIIIAGLIDRFDFRKF